MPAVIDQNTPARPSAARSALQYARTERVRSPQSLAAGEPSAPTPSIDGTTAGRLERGASAGAMELLRRTRRALSTGDLDGATLGAEKLLELAAWGHDAGVARVVVANIAWLDRVFAARVGPGERRLEVGIAGLETRPLDLQPRAMQLLEFARGGTTVRELLSGCGFSRRHAARLIAGLLRRHILIAL